MEFWHHIRDIGTLLAPSALLVGLGFGLGRFGRMPDATALAALVTDVATPCLIFSVFTQMRLDPIALAQTALASAACLVCFCLLSVVVLWVTGLRIRTYLGPLSFPNTGNLGIPVAAAAFGPVGIAYATIFYAVSSLSNCIFGQALASGSADCRKLARMPLLYAVALSLLVSLGGVEVPAFVSRPVSLMAATAIPMMLLMLGAAVAGLKPTNVPRSVALSVLRLSMGAAVGYIVARAFGLTGAPSTTLIIQAAMPVAVNSYLFAQRWNCEPAEVAAMVAVSTIGSCLTIPLILAALSG